jgi:hypothetical protein
MSVWKLAVIMFIITSVVFAGAGVLIVTSVPALYDAGMKLIPMASLAGFAIAAVVSIIVARQLVKPA